MTAVALVIAVMSSLLAGVVLATPAGAATAASLDQCANGPLADPVDCTDAGDWVNGALVASKAHLFEGDSVPYRMVMTGLTAGTSYPLTFEWDTTKGGKHALDYITTFDRTVAGANPCFASEGCSGAATTFPIPGDTNVSGAGVTQIPGVFTLFGGAISAVSPYTLSGSYAGDSSTRITVTFTASDDTSVLAWGGHISSRQDWGMANSAVSITGSPYHTRLIDFDGKGGNQDRSLAAAAVIFPGSITIIKDAVPDDAQDFSFSTTGGLLPATFSLDDDADPTLSNTQTFTNITTFGAYTITEAAAADWTLSFGNPLCTVTTPNGGSQSVNLATLTINLNEGENVTCTLINTRQSGTLRVNKVVLPAGDLGRFNLEINGATAGTGGTVGNGGTTGAIPVVTGVHTVRETAGTNTQLSGYTSSIACSDGTTLLGSGGPLNVTVMSGDNVACTITNTRISDCPPTARIAASRGTGCPGEDPGDPTDDNPIVPGPAAPAVDPTVDPVIDPGVGGAGDTNPLQPVDQVLSGTTEQPAPADPAPLGGFLPRTGAGIAGQALLALLLMAAGLTLRLARRRRSPQA